MSTSSNDGPGIHTVATTAGWENQQNGPGPVPRAWAQAQEHIAGGQIPSPNFNKVGRASMGG